jgi:hypothetical protein
MQNVETLYHQAMELVDDLRSVGDHRAVLARQQGDESASLEFLQSAFQQERSAADLVADQWDLEPTRSVLHRSAASLAIECAQLREAERLIGRALAGNPPADIADELRDLLLDAVYSQRQAIWGLTYNGGRPTPSTENPMLEIHQRYILDDAGTPIAVQIPIAQFETLLQMLRNPAEVTVVTEEAGLSVEELRGAAAIGLQALEDGKYTDYDAEGLLGLFDWVKKRSCLRPSQVVQLLKSYDLPLLMLVAVRLDRRRQAKPLLDRNDLQQLGYKPGKEFKLILAAVLAATLDGGGASLEVIAAYIKSQGTDD